MKQKIAAAVLLAALTAFGADKYTKSIKIETDPPGSGFTFASAPM